MQNLPLSTLNDKPARRSLLDALCTEDPSASPTTSEELGFSGFLSFTQKRFDFNSSSGEEETDSFTCQARKFKSDSQLGLKHQKARKALAHENSDPIFDDDFGARPGELTLRPQQSLKPGVRHIPVTNLHLESMVRRIEPRELLVTSFSNRRMLSSSLRENQVLVGRTTVSK